MPSRLSGLQLLLVAFLIALVAPKGALSAGRSLQATLSTCKSYIDTCHCIDTSTMYAGDVKNAAAAVIQSFGVDNGRYHVNSCDGKGVLPQTDEPKCSGDQSAAVASCWKPPVGYGKPHWSNCIKDCLDRFEPSDHKQEIHLYVNNPDSACTLSEKQDAMNRAKAKNVGVVFHDLACTPQGVKPSMGALLCSGPDKYHQVIQTTATKPAPSPQTLWSSSCKLWYQQPDRCPIKCRANTVLNVVANGRTKQCSVTKCTGSSVGTSCYQVYESGLSSTTTLSVSLSPIVVNAGQTFTTPITVTPANGQASCNGTVTINCQLPGPACRSDTECWDPDTSTGYYPLPEGSMCTASKCIDGYCKYMPAKGSCDDGNACTGSPPGPDGTDQCDGINMGYQGCSNPASSFGPPTTVDCVNIIPPVTGSLCYDLTKGATCNKLDGKCYWQLRSDAIDSGFSANAYCGTWGAGFAGQLATYGNNSAGSTAASRCLASCSTGTCAQTAVPACTCSVMASSFTLVQVGTAAPCPSDLKSAGFSCANITGVMTNTPTNGSLCWVPDSNIKNGGPGSFADCNGTSLTAYTLTGASSSAQCMGCLSFGYAYSANATKCYAANASAPVDPNTPHKRYL